MDGSWIGILYIIGLFGLLWFLMIRPQQKRQKQHAEMVQNLKVNDRVITIGGVYGTIIKVKEESLIIKVAENVRMEFLKNAVAQIIDSPNLDKNSD